MVPLLAYTAVITETKKSSLFLKQAWMGLLGYSRISGFRYLSDSIKNGFKIHFECEFSPFRIQILTGSHPGTGNQGLISKWVLRF